MVSKYTCGTCRNRTDCSEVGSQAVKDVSNRCGLMCHSEVRPEYEIRKDERAKMVKKISGWVVEKELNGVSPEDCVQAWLELPIFMGSLI